MVISISIERDQSNFYYAASYQIGDEVSDTSPGDDERPPTPEIEQGQQRLESKCVYCINCKHDWGLFI